MQRSTAPTIDMKSCVKKCHPEIEDFLSIFGFKKWGGEPRNIIPSGIVAYERPPILRGHFCPIWFCYRSERAVIVFFRLELRFQEHFLSLSFLDTEFFSEAYHFFGAGPGLPTDE